MVEYTNIDLDPDQGRDPAPGSPWKRLADMEEILAEYEE